MALFKKKATSMSTMSDPEQEAFADDLLRDLAQGRYPSFKQIMTIKQLRPDLRSKVDAALAEAPGDSKL